MDSPQVSLHLPWDSGDKCAPHPSASGTKWPWGAAGTGTGGCGAVNEMCHSLSTLSGAPQSFPCSRGVLTAVWQCSSLDQVQSPLSSAFLGLDCGKGNAYMAVGRNISHFWASQDVHPSLGRMKFIAGAKWCSTTEQGLSQPIWPWQAGHINSYNLLNALWKPFKDFLSLCPELQLTIPSSYWEGGDRWMQTMSALGRETCYDGTCRDW